MLLEGESSMVRWPLNGLDLTHFHYLCPHLPILLLDKLVNADIN
jgi:hypothetical protein